MLLREGTTSIRTLVYSGCGLVKKREWAWSNFKTTTTPIYDAASRTVTFAHDLLATASDVTYGYGYIASGQLDHVSRDNDVYAWDGQPAGPYRRAYTTNGLNQYEAAGTAAFCYDPNGNLTADGSSVFLYDAENRLVERRVQGVRGRGGSRRCRATRLRECVISKALWRFAEIRQSWAKSTCSSSITIL